MAQFNLEVKGLPRPERIDAYLAKALKDGYSREEVKRAIQEGTVRLNGQPVKPRNLVKEGDRIEADISSSKSGPLSAEKLPLDVVHQDADILVVDKPAGMVVHPGAGHKGGTLVNALLGAGASLSDLSGKERPGIVHRLDKETSGLIVIAKNNRAHRILQSQFADRSFSKTYLALVKGRVEFEEGRVDLPIGRHPKVRTKMAVSREESAREAETRYKVLKRFKYATLLEIKLMTGRTHQIRVHMADLGHPVIGDELYGTRGEFGRHALHAARIAFLHPKSGKLVSFESDPPEDFKRIVEKFEKET